MSLLGSDEEFATELRSAYADEWMELPASGILRRARSRRRRRIPLAAAVVVVVLAGGYAGVSQLHSTGSSPVVAAKNPYGIVLPPVEATSPPVVVTKAEATAAAKHAVTACRNSWNHDYRAKNGPLPPLVLSTQDGRRVLRIYANDSSQGRSDVVCDGDYAEPQGTNGGGTPGPPLAVAQGLSNETSFESNNGPLRAQGSVWGIVTPDVTSAQMRLNDGTVVTPTIGKDGYIGYSDRYGRVDQADLTTHSAAGTYAYTRFGLPLMPSSCKGLMAPCTTTKMTRAQQLAYCIDQAAVLLREAPGLTPAQRAMAHPVLQQFDGLGAPPIVLGSDSVLMVCQDNQFDAWFPTMPFSMQSTAFTDMLAGVGIGIEYAVGHVPAGTQEVELVAGGKSTPVAVDAGGFYFTAWSTQGAVKIVATTATKIYALANGRLTVQNR